MYKDVFCLVISKETSQGSLNPNMNLIKVDQFKYVTYVSRLIERLLELIQIRLKY